MMQWLRAASLADQGIVDEWMRCFCSPPARGITPYSRSFPGLLLPGSLPGH